jgi:uncharacterized damage-inducible protein DinB
MVLHSTWCLVVAFVVNAGMLACSSQAGSTAGPTNGGGPAAQLADLQKDWRVQKDTMVKLAAAMPPDKFSYKPTSAQRTFGEQVLHVAVGNVAVMKLLGGKREPPFAIEPNRPDAIQESSANILTKEEIVKALSDAYDFGEAVLAEQTPESINMLLGEGSRSFGTSTRARVVWSLLSHAMDIYGQMVVYVRLNGIVPPASRGV